MIECLERIRRLAVILALPLALAACSNEAPRGGTDAAPNRSASTTSGDTAAGKHVAVSHGFTLRLPGAEIEAAQQKHLAECARLGCSVLHTSIDREEHSVRASSSVRIAPGAYPAFAGAITAPPVLVLSHTENADDKTVAVLDIEKRLEMKTALRDRLAAILRDPAPKTIAELVTLEKELASVQGDIESGTAQRDYLRTITKTVKVDIAYRSAVAEAGGADVSPIVRAFKNMGRTFMGSVASLIVFVTWVVPWLPLIYLAMWGIRRMFRRWRAQKAAP
jgi:hypothetical protein